MKGRRKECICGLVLEQQEGLSFQQLGWDGKGFTEEQILGWRVSGCLHRLGKMRRHWMYESGVETEVLAGDRNLRIISGHMEFKTKELDENTRGVGHAEKTQMLSHGLSRIRRLGRSGGSDMDSEGDEIRRKAGRVWQPENQAMQVLQREGREQPYPVIRRMNTEHWELDGAVWMFLVILPRVILVE